ncbi:ankyrin repeat domain-containing protein [Haemophilus haemoglobinophilus]|nr:ankyrin repeat domain-containing protein [Canicola haemoglobinophilus]
MLALDMGNTNLFELFIKKGVVLNLKVNDKTRLIEAVENSNVKAVRILLNHGVNVEEKDKDGRTALHYNFIKDPYTENDRQIGILLTVVGLSPFEEDVNQIPAYGYLKNVKSVKDFIDIKNLLELPEYKLERIEKIKEKTKPRSDILAEYKDVTVKKISKPKSFASYYYPKPSGNKKR